MSKRYKLDYNSPIGVIEIEGTEEGVCSILFVERDKQEDIPQGDSQNISQNTNTPQDILPYSVATDVPQPLLECLQQLDEYFKGERRDFTFPYFFESGTPFQREVWHALTTIPYGETGTYGKQASTIGRDKAVRAVGSANGQNKLSIVVPCHRIIGSNGKLTGYAGGLWRKEWLLEHERASLKGNSSLETE